MRIILFLLASVSLLSAAPLKTAQLLAEGKEPVRIACIGDSITGVYYHSGGQRAYPEMLQIALQKIHPQAEVAVRNAGISGDTTTRGLLRLERDVLAYKPHLVTIMFGMNDLVRTPVADFQNNLREIIRRCRAIDAEVILCTQNSVVENPKWPPAKVAEFTMPSTTSKLTRTAISKRSGRIKPVRIPMLSAFPRTEEFDAKVVAMGGISLTAAARKKYARFLK